jgi:hypothetical protein
MHQSGNWFLALPAYFLLAPEGLIAHAVLVVSLVFVGVKHSTGWKLYILSALCPIAVQIVMLSVVGAAAGRTPEALGYGVLICTTLLSLYLIYRSFLFAGRRGIRFLVACSQVYATILVTFLGIMTTNNSWL